MTTETPIRKLNAYLPRGLLHRLATAPDEAVQSHDGTVVFVDLSGFTRLSERLARKGREGAEQIVDTINSCFSVLLSEAYENGGSLLKFGGDALLLWFEGDGHALRACASAVRMRRTLRQIGRIRAGGSEVVLRMSVGVHSGTYEHFLVGASHRECLIAGPAASVVVAMEGAASAGQILVSPDTAARLPASWLGAACGPGVLLARASLKEAWSGDTPTMQPADDAVAGCLSTALRAHLLSAPAPPEHRTATVAFLQFGRLDGLIETRGAEAASAALDEIVRSAQEAADRYEVCFLASDVAGDGGKLLFSAGAPRAVGDDEERMLLAMRQILESDPPLPLRIGVNRGYTFTGEVGPPYRRTYAVMGDVVNLAARLMAKAPWGELFTLESVLRRSGTRFETTSIPPFLVKGKIRPITALQVGSAVRVAPHDGEVERLPLIGREDEVATIEQAIENAKRGRGTLIDLIGETGSGKSRLLGEARARAASMAVIHTRCETFSRAIPYIAWRDPIRQLLGVGWDDPDPVVMSRLRAVVAAEHPQLLPWLPLLAIVAGAEALPTRAVAELSPDFRTAKLHDVVLTFLQAALENPTLVLIEHAHLMDEASAALLDALATRLAHSAWVVIAARRNVDGGFLPQPPVVRMELGPLSPAATRALAEAASEAHIIPPHMLDLAVERSAGSPAFLMDLMAAVAGGSDELPDNIEAAASARIDALEPGDRALVRRAAIFGLTMRRHRLRHVLEPGAAEPDDATWRRLSSVFAEEEDGQLRFRSPTLCEAAYLGLPFGVRRPLHGAVANALERDLGHDPDAEPAVLSRHFSLAGDYAKAWKYALLGAERARARFAHADAARLYRRAIEAGRANAADPSKLAAAWEAMGEELRLTGEPKAALRALTEARRLLVDDPLAEARLFYRHADVAERHERLTAAVRWLRRGLRRLDGVKGAEADVWRARLIADLGGVRMRQGRTAEAIRLSEEAIAIAEPRGELRATARACYLLDWALMESGRSAEATHSQRALEIYAELRDPEREGRVVHNLGTFAYTEGRWDDAVTLYRRGGELSRRAGNLGLVAGADCNIGEILSDQGRLDEAATYLERALRVWRSVGQLQGLAFATMLLGRLAVRDGRAGEGIELVEAAAGELARLNLGVYVGLARACVAEAEAFGDDPGRAIALADQFLAGGSGDVAILRRARGIALARCGQVRSAIEELQRSADAAAEAGIDYDRAAALDLLEVLEGSGEHAAERDEILARLQIVRLPRPPLGAEVSGREPAVAA